MISRNVPTSELVAIDDSVTRELSTLVLCDTRSFESRRELLTARRTIREELDRRASVYRSVVA